MIEQLISLAMGLTSGSAIAFIFYKIFTKKYEKLLNFANSLVEKMENTEEIREEYDKNTEKIQEGISSENPEIKEIDREIAELRRQIVATKDPRMFNFLKQKIRYLESRKRYIESGLWRYSGKGETSPLEMDLSQINWQELLANVDKLPDEQLIALVSQFKRYIPKQFRAYANNPLLVRMFLKHIAPLLIPKEQQPQQPQPEKKEVISI
jgi:hypothetical protein